MAIQATVSGKMGLGTWETLTKKEETLTKKKETFIEKKGTFIEKEGTFIEKMIDL
jgi:hypothetical protein